MEYKGGWTLMKKVFPVLDEHFSLPFEDTATETDIKNAIHLLSTYKMTETIQSLVISKVEKYFRTNIVPPFWAYFDKPNTASSGFRQFYMAIEMLYTDFAEFLNLMFRVDAVRSNSGYNESIYGEDSAVSALKLIVRATILAQFPIKQTDIIGEFYETALRIEDNAACPVCMAECTKCNCVQYFYETNRKLVELGLLEPLVGQALTEIIYKYIENHIIKTCKDSFDVSYIGSLEKWLDCVVLHWLRKIYSQCFSDLNECIQKFKQKLIYFLYETYTKLRINQLFNIIIEYPDSLPALEDLSLCLPRTDLKPMLTKRLKMAMETRLLHSGVSTPDILTAYIASIRSMRVLDPSGLLLETVTQPVHHYLRSRSDTVRCVVSSLTEDGPNDLVEELVRGEVLNVSENGSPDEESENWESWMPDPVDVDPNRSSNIRRSSDIISMLVNVYGSKELFVNEYRTLLADRLLSQFSCDTEKEIRYLELLKLRFGDSQLHYCEVMLKDVADSKRINHHIKQDVRYFEEQFPISAMIVSAQFWPPFKDEKLELHPTVMAQMMQYTNGFEALKGNRSLVWKSHLGAVDLEIGLPDRVLNLTVTPVHATILMHFQDKNEWDLNDLSRVMQVPPTVLRKKIGFWQSHNLVNEVSPDVFVLNEEQANKSLANADVIEDYESESAMASTQDQREEELQTFWSYIVGMLMNLDSLPLERIHQMLKMFAFQGATIECSTQELRHFLDRKVREHQLVYSGGLYKLPKSDT